MNSFYLVALIHWFPNGKDLQEEDSRMSSPWKLHVVNTACCYKGQMNTQKCPGSPSHSSAVLVYSGKRMQLSSAQFWERSYLGVSTPQILRKGLSRRDGKGFGDGKVLLPCCGSASPHGSTDPLYHAP